MPRAQECPYVSIVPQYSPDLEQWTAIESKALSTAADGRVTVRLPLSGFLYLRLLVTAGG